jgi:hypothetical protein
MGADQTTNRTMHLEPKQPFGFFEAILSASVLAVAVFLSFYFMSDIRQPETVRLTYLGLESKNSPEDAASTAKAQLCLDSDLPCLPSSLDGALLAERPSE